MAALALRGGPSLLPAAIVTLQSARVGNANVTKEGRRMPEVILFS
jgi:hypothetical protein